MTTTGLSVHRRRWRDGRRPRRGRSGDDDSVRLGVPGGELPDPGHRDGAAVNGRHRAPARAARGRFRLRVLGAVVALVMVAGAGSAHALWTTSSTGSYALAQASTLTAPTLSTGSVAATSVALSWTKPFAPTAYALSQSTGSLAGCAAAPSAASSGCTATGLTPNTSYTWTLTAYLSSWSKQATVSATTSKQATATALSNITPTTATTGTTFSATATVTGSSGFGTPAGTVVFSLFTSSSCTGGASYATSAQALSGGAATGSLQPAAGTYYWRATYTPTDTYNLTSTSACSSAITVTTPTSTIGLNYYSMNGDVYSGSRPTALTGGLSVINQGGSVLRTLTSLTVTTSFPDTRVSGAAPLAVTGTGWAYTGSTHVGAEWVYTFTWTGTLDPWASTPSLTITIPLSDNSPGSIPTTATASNMYTNTPSVTSYAGI